MSDRLVFNDIPVELTPEFVSTALGKRVGRLKLDDYLPLANKIARPKAIINWVDSEVIDDSHVKIAGHVFESVLLADKLKDLHKVVVYVATAGEDIMNCDEIKSTGVKDMLGAAVLRYARNWVNDFLARELNMQDVGSLLPGSLPDWPVINNHAICEIVGNIEEIGVTIKDNGYMQPWNSSSGILFAGSVGYYNCMLCTKLTCVNRRAEFNEEEYRRLFR